MKFNFELKLFHGILTNSMKSSLVYVIDCIVVSSLCIVMEKMCMCLEYREEVLNEGCVVELWLLGLLDEI